MEGFNQASFADLVACMSTSGALVVTPGRFEPPASLDIALAMVGMQMVAPRLNRVAGQMQPVELGASDVAAMLELVGLTKPGPFAPRTYEMGRYLGVFEGVRLIAMAGEKLRLPGFTEVSAVCTHPDYRGRGFAKVLVSAIADGVQQRGETPILHVVATNDAAIRTYESLGFAKRSDVQFTFLKRAAGAAN